MIYDSICIMLPTYGRSNTLLPKFITSCTATADILSNLKFAFCVNEKDYDTYNYLKSLPWPKKENVLIVQEFTKEPNLAVYFNILYHETKKFGERCLVSMLGDDMEFLTQGWDSHILNIVNRYKGVGVFWCNDDYIAKEKMCVNAFWSRMFIDATEYPFMAEVFRGDMIDYVWRKIAKYTKTAHYLPNVIIKHNHNTSKPQNQWDSTFNRLRPAQQQGHKVGKGEAKKIAHLMADNLIKKGLTGNAID